MKNHKLIEMANKQGNDVKNILLKMFLHLCTGFIFDMDGILIDSERVRLDMIIKASNQTCPNKPLNEKILKGHLGLTFKEAHQKCKLRFGDDYPYEKIRALATELEFDYYETKQVPIKEGVVHLLELAQSLNIPCSIGTSSNRDIAEYLMDLAELGKYFANITGGDEIQEGGGKKAIFELAASRLGVSVKECFVFEDSTKGLEGAIQTGAIPVAVPDLVNPDNYLLEKSFLFNTLEEFAVLLQNERQKS